MIDLAIGAALLLAVGAVFLKAVRARRERTGRQAAVADTPGYSADRPLAVTSFHEIDDAIDTWRCPCGGPLDRIGEGARTGPLGPVRVVRCACTICEEDVDLFFDLADLRH